MDQVGFGPIMDTPEATIHGWRKFENFGVHPKKINGSAQAANMIQNFMKPKFATAIFVVVTAVYKCCNMGTFVL